MCERRCFRRLPCTTTGTGEERTAKILAIRKAFEQALPEGTWHPQLVQEIVGEDHSSGSGELMEKLIASLAIPQPAAPKPDDDAARRIEILGAVQDLSGTAEDIGYCESVLVENEHALERSRLSFFQRVRRWFQKSLGRLDDRFYDIEHRASPGADGKTESIDFLRFVSEMKELKAVFAEIMETGSPGNQRIEKMNTDRLCDFLDWQLRQLRQLHVRMEGLNTVFQVQAVHDRGGWSARSIKLELLAIENTMNRADAVRRESIAALEAKPKK